MAKISIVTSSHFCTNPRVWREADALSQNGHSVTVIGIWFDPSHAELDRQMLKSRNWKHIPAADLRGFSLNARFSRAWARIKTRTGRHLVNALFNNPHALGYGVSKLLDAARQERADLTIVHLEPAFWVGAKLHREGMRVGADFEDWHSENSVNGDLSGRQRRFYSKLEATLLHSASHLTTTSRAMADALLRNFNGKQLEVIYNSVAAVPAETSLHNGKTLRLIWFSQTVGEGRGLEDLFRALPKVEGEWTLDLVANASAESIAWLERQIPEAIRSHVRLCPAVPPDELTGVVAKYDLGLALEVPSCRNKDLTASNKIFHYLQCGLTVVASDTAGQREVLDSIPGSGYLYPSGDVARLAELLNTCLKESAKLLQRRQQIHNEANRCLAYERQIPRLLSSVEKALYA